MKLRTKLKVKKRPSVEDPRVAQVRAALQHVSERRAALNEHLMENHDVIMQYLSLSSALDHAKEAAKPAVRALCKDGEHGRQIVCEAAGWRASVQVTHNIDAERLLQDHPKLRKVAKVKLTMPMTEGDRLVGANLLTAQELRNYKVVGNRSVFLETVEES